MNKELLNKIREAYENESPTLGALLKEAGFNDDQLNSLREAYENEDDSAFGKIITSGPTSIQSEREKLGMTREEYGKYVSDQTAEEIKNQRLKSVVEENPTLSALFPRTAEAIAEGERGSGGAVLDVGSLPFRTGMAGTEALAAETFGDDLSGMGAFMSGLARTGEEEGLSTADYVASEFPILEDRGISPIEAQEIREGEGAWTEIGRGALTDPINILPFGKAAQAAVKGAKGSKYLSKYFPVAEEAGEAVAKSFPVDPAASTIGRKMVEGLPTGIPKKLKGLPKPPRPQSPKDPNRLAEWALESGIEGGLEAGAETTAQALGDKDMDLGSIMIAGAAPGVLGGIGEGLKSSAKHLYQGRVNLKPKDQNKRFAPEIDVLFEDDLMPIVPLQGDRKVLQNVGDKLSEVQRMRGKVAEEKAKTLGEAEDVIKQYPLTGQTPEVDAAYETIKREGVPFNLMFDDARMKVARDIESGKIDSDEAKSVLDYINRQEQLMEQDFGASIPLGLTMGEDVSKYTGYTTPGAIAAAGNRWFDTGRLNRQLSSQDPSRPAAIGSEMVWDASRPYLDNIDEYKETSKLFRRYLPLEKALQDKMGALTNRSMLEGGTPGSAGFLEPFRGPATTGNMYRLGKAMSYNLPEPKKSIKESTRGEIASELASGAKVPFDRLKYTVPKETYEYMTQPEENESEVDRRWREYLLEEWKKKQK